MYNIHINIHICITYRHRYHALVVPNLIELFFLHEGFNETTPLWRALGFLSGVCLDCCDLWHNHTKMI